MTVTEMHRAFKFGMDKLDSVNYPNFLSDEIDLLLNQAQERFIKQRYGINNPKRTSFEETQKRVDDLRELIRDVTLSGAVTSSTNISPQARFFTLPADYWFAVQERVEQGCDKCNDHTVSVTILGIPFSLPAKYAEVRPIQHHEFDKVVTDAFKAPDYDKVLRLMYDGSVELIAPSYCSIYYYKLRYIKKPQAISITTPTNCELADHTHQEIVDEAIKIALEGIEAKRNNTFSPIIDNTKE